jgi:hypothetical protein
MSISRLAGALIGAVVIAAFALPGVASANTGSVKCDDTGVVFTYNANFGRDKVSTETVNGVVQTFLVKAHVVSTHTWPVFGTLTVGATWSGGSIPTVTLHCEAPPVPVAPPPAEVTPPPAPPAPPAPVAPPAVVTPPVSPPGATPSVTRAPPPVISITKRALATTVAAGKKVRYELVVKSTGGTAHDVVVCDKLPLHMTYVWLGKATLDDGKACWAVGDLKEGSLTLSLTARVDFGTGAGSLSNNATVTSSDAGRDKAHATIKVPAAKHGVKGKLKRTAGVTG